MWLAASLSFDNYEINFFRISKICKYLKISNVFCRGFLHVFILSTLFQTADQVINCYFKKNVFNDNNHTANTVILDWLSKFYFNQFLDQLIIVTLNDFLNFLKLQ
jgi:hypothetical protein